jgi:hypothetical protein
LITREKSKLEQVLDIIQHEPNYETFEYRGFKVVIKRMMYLGGQLNGYVRIPKAHKFYQKGYDDIPIECHGGLTFAGDLEEDGDWYIGFDTAHYRDFIPFMKFALPDPLRNREDFGETYKDIDYVRQECKRIVDQLRVQ